MKPQSPERPQSKLLKEQQPPTPDTSVNLSCYSDLCPPELEALVVVQVIRVDDTGVWGSLVDWGQDRCTAYLPIGSIGKEKGRGERKAQRKFLTIASRSVSSRKKATIQQGMTFAAYVQSVDDKSYSGVADCPGGDIGQRQFHVTVTRRGVTEEIEKSAIELSREIQHCAHHLVDKAAIRASVSRQWARQVTMHAAYERAVTSSESTEDNEPESAPVRFLVKTLGSVEQGDTTTVLDQLSLPNHDTLTEEQINTFVESLLDLCRKEKLRRSKPVTFSLTTGVDGLKTAMQNMNSLSQWICDIQHLQSAFKAVSILTPPTGCEEATVVVTGNGKFTLSTIAPPDLEANARDYLASVSLILQETWLESASKAGSTIVDSHKQNEATSNALQPSLSIGVIGDVANGKSTLVKAISGKKPQAHSSEQQQHGITIRLGFANAAVHRCQNNVDTCGAYSFLPETLDDGKPGSLPSCTKCNHTTSVVKRFSLVDCPGHAELMATMLAGASAFDAVLLAAASNVPCPTPQARQHLEAIKMSGVINEKLVGQNPPIAIAQTKAELLADDSKNSASRFTPEERLKSHADQGRDKMRKSVAASAPIFPICAPLGLGLDAIAEWIANIPSSPCKTPSNSKTTNLTVLRSFDINRPGKLASDLNGGILGGTIEGDGSISVGDVLEVRPGLCLSKPQRKATPPEERRKDQRLNKNKPSTKEAPAETSSNPFQVQPLRFQCTSLMTGQNKLRSVTKGGLVAVGTTLDPLICCDNRMVGSVAGPPGSLPPVWGPALFLNNLQFVDLLPESGHKEAKNYEPSDLLKKGSDIKVHIGSCTVKGRVIRVSKSRGRLEAFLDSPICALRGANVALEGKGTNGYCLVAHAKLVDGDTCLAGVEESHQLTETTATANDLDNVESTVDGQDSGLTESDEYFRKRFLDDLKSCKEDQLETMGGSRLSVPLPDIARDGGAHVLLSNFGAITHSLRRDPGHLVLFLQKEGGLSCVLAGDRLSPATTMLRVKWRGGRGFAERFMSILKKYIRAYVACNQCKGAVTELLGTSKTEQACRHCNARRFVPKL